MKPTRREIVRLARAECDPRRYREFAPIAHGPVVAVLILVLVAIAAILLVPVRLVRSLF